LRVVFLGTPAAAVPCLERLAGGGHDLTLVITQPDRPSGRSGTPAPPPVKAAALAHGLPVAQPAKVRDRAFLDLLRAARPDVLVVVAYGRILPVPVLELGAHGAVNVHFSLLPRYRGAAPVAWALVRGETQTGVTTMRLSERLDEGDIFLQRPLAVGAREHAPALLERLAQSGADLLAETLAGLAATTIPPRPQDHAAATYAPVLTRADGAWDPAWTAAEVEGRVRGFDPWPGVWAARKGRRLRLVEAEALDARAQDAPPGTVLGLEGARAWVACAAGTVLAVDAVLPEGRRVVAAREAFHGRHLSAGDVLATPVAPPA
jgi:methionyl-tRNA formyltransferase